MLWLRKRRRLQLTQLEFPREWIAIIERNVPYYRRLSGADQGRLRGLARIFLEEKRFEGCGGLILTDEIRMTIAAQACVLLIGGQSDIYPKLRSILVYPDAYLAPAVHHHPDGTVSEGLQPRLGESWSLGNVVLSWGDILRNATGHAEGRNVVFHEFAHQLDSESGSANGAPILENDSRYADWADVLGKEYEALVASVESGFPTLLDRYGAVSPAEFFAVATEYFFEIPLELRSVHPELYEQLKLYYRQNPALNSGT